MQGEPLSMRRNPLPLILAAILAIAPAQAVELASRVVGIADGDTLTLLTPEQRQVRVRLAEVDTPERRQPYGTRARQALTGLVFGQAVRVVVQETGCYARTVGRVHAGPVNVNAKMVRQGAAWVYRRYSRDPTLPVLKAEAHAARRGLWALPEAECVPPWQWRAEARKARAGG